MALAIEACRSGKLSTRRASQTYCVPRTTLLDRVAGRIDHDNAKWGKDPHLAAVEEQELIEYAMGRVNAGLGLSKQSFLRYVGQYAASRGKGFKGGVPSEKWWVLFKKRHPHLSLRQPEPTALARHKGMERERVSAYFANVLEALTENGLLDKPERLWNMDETGVILSHRPSKVIAR